MMANDEINKKADEYISYFEKHKEDIPNIDKLIKLLKSDNKTGHIVHAEFVKRFFECNKFKVTDVEKKYNDYDVDIELMNASLISRILYIFVLKYWRINLQIWYGASFSTHELDRKGLEAKEETIEGKKVRVWRGGVPTNWNADEEKIDLGRLNDGDEETVIFTFRVPPDFDAGSYKLAVKAYSDASNSGENLECTEKNS